MHNMASSEPILRLVPFGRASISAERERESKQWPAMRSSLDVNRHIEAVN
jgi:hypothetical protein